MRAFNAAATAREQGGGRLQQVLRGLLHQHLRGGLGVVEQAVHLIHIVGGDLLPALRRGHDARWREQLHGVAQGGAQADVAKLGDGLVCKGVRQVWGKK